MSTVQELLHRVETLEETVNHLTTHHDEQFLMVHDDVTADTCDRLFNVNLRQAQAREQATRSGAREHRVTRRKQRKEHVKRQHA